jgi:hypothetical protein
MKKMVASLLILGVFWGGALLWQNHVDEHVLSLSGKCQEAMDNIALGENSRAEDAMVEFHRLWESSTDHWAMMMDHTTLAAIEEHFALAQSYHASGEYGLAYGELAALLNDLAGIPRLYRLEWKNIL